MKKKKFRNHYIDRYYNFIPKTRSWETKKLKDGCLYYYGDKNYVTKIKPEDLPESFMSYWNGVALHFLNGAGVVDIVYQPVINNHVFKDDSLYISYTKKIKYKQKYDDIDERFSGWLEVEDEGEYERIWGRDIVEFLLFAEKYSGFDIEPIKEQMWNKMLLLQKYEEEIFNSYVVNKEKFESMFNLDRLNL